MAVLFIKKVSATVGNCLAYASHDKVEPITKNDIADVINYARNDKTGMVTFKTLSTTLNCPSMGQDTLGDFNELIQKFSKVKNKRRNIKSQGTPALAFHLVQSFDKGMTPLLANQIGLETSEKLFGDKYRVQISTHTNTENIHNHIVFCAWGEDGKKWHDCHASMREMRQVSDAICQEHGLAILEATKDYKLVKKEVEQGKYLYYEPTDRKNRMIHKRDSHDVTNANVNGYRNSTGYNRFEQKTENKRDIICNDISIYLRFATDYEHLLELLQVQAGYEIKSKKKNGDWLEHIAFKPPSTERFIRDNSLADGFYTRENLTRLIAEQQEHKIVTPSSEIGQDEMANILIMDSYKYGDVDVSKLHEKVRAERSIYDGETVYREREEMDAGLVKVIKHHDKELHDELVKYGYDYSVIDRVIHDVQEREKLEKYSMRQKQEAYVQQAVEEIQALLNALKFVERIPFQNYEYMVQWFERMQKQCDVTKKEIAEIDKQITAKEHLLKLPQELKVMQERIEQNKNNIEYQEFEFGGDKERVAKCKEVLHEYYPKTDGEMNVFQSEIKAFREKRDALAQKLFSLEKELEAMRFYVDIIQSCRNGAKDRPVEQEAVDIKTDIRNTQLEHHTIEKRKKKTDRER